MLVAQTRLVRGGTRETVATVPGCHERHEALVSAGIPVEDWPLMDMPVYDLQASIHLVTHGVQWNTGPEGRYGVLILTAACWQSDEHRLDCPLEPYVLESFHHTMPFAWKRGSSKHEFIVRILRQQIVQYQKKGLAGDFADWCRVSEAVWDVRYPILRGLMDFRNTILTLDDLSRQRKAA